MIKKIKEFLIYEKIVNDNTGTEQYNNVIANYLYMYFERTDTLTDTKDLVLFYKQNTDVSNKTINKCIKLLRQVHKHHKIVNDDLTDFKLLKEKHVAKKVIKVNELKAIFKYLDNMQDRGNATSYKMITYILYDTGIRPNELLNIEKNNIDLEKRFLYLETTKTGIPRHVFMSQEITIRLKEYLKINNNSKYLFYNNLRNRQFNRNDLKSFWRRVKKATNISVLNSYMFRHTYITDLIDLNVPLVVVQNQAGHSKISTTMIYYHNSTKVQAEALKAVKREI